MTHQQTRLCYRIVLPNQASDLVTNWTSAVHKEVVDMDVIQLEHWGELCFNECTQTEKNIWIMMSRRHVLENSTCFIFKYPLSWCLVLPPGVTLTESGSKRICFKFPPTQSPSNLTKCFLFKCHHTASSGMELPYLVSTMAVYPPSCQDQDMDKENCFCNIPLMLCCIYSMCESSVNKWLLCGVEIHNHFQ